MNKMYLYLVIAAVVILAGARVYVSRQRSAQVIEPSPSPVSSAIPQEGTLQVIVALSSQNNSGEQGTATLTELTNGKTKVTLNLTGAPQGVPQPSHVHLGSCANLGDVYLGLNTIVNGQAETIIDASLQNDILNKLPLAVNVHKSQPEIATYFSCGDIMAQTSPTASPRVTGSPRPTNTPTSSPQNSPDNRRGADKPED